MYLKTKSSFVFLFFCISIIFSFNVLECEALTPPMDVVYANIDTESKEVSISLLTLNTDKDFVITVTNPNGEIDYTGEITPTQNSSQISYTTKSLIYGKYNVVAECKDIDAKYQTIFNYYVYGDLTHDGKANSSDYNTLRRFILKLIEEFPEPEWKITGDLNRDEKINSIDYSILRKFVLGITNDIPVITLDIEKINWRTEIDNIQGNVILDFEGTTNADKLVISSPWPGSPSYYINVDSAGKFKDSLVVAYVKTFEIKSYQFSIDIHAQTEGVKTVTFTQKSGELTFDFATSTPSPINEVSPDPTSEITQNDPQPKIDDWEYSYTTGMTGSGSMVLPSMSPSLGVQPSINSGMPLPSAAPNATIGFSTGGAKDINNFRENIENNFFPQYSSLTYEGLFYDYYFDTGKQEETEKLFSPSYTYAVSSDPISGESEYYLSVGLNSGMKQEDFNRKKLNLTIVLDISGSMSSNFDSYYYDKNTLENEVDEDNNKNKLKIACESIVGLLGHLNDDDRFGLVLFDGNAYTAKRLNLVGKTDMDAIKNHILELTPQGSTNFEAGYKNGTQLFDVLDNSNPYEYENRIIFLTDAMPNVGSINEDSLLKLTEKNAQNRIYTTFIGIGVDFNTDLIEYITKIKGANYYSVHSSKQFKTRMDEEFEYMVTPLVFNLQLNLESKGFKIEKVYGSPESDESTGEIMKVNTLFPSKVSNEETKGGLVLLKLKKISDDSELILSTSYEDRNGKVDKDTVSVTFEDKKPDFYQNNGIRKGILLSRYVNLLKNWILYEAEKDSENPDDIIYRLMADENGIILPDDDRYIQILNKWEHQSVPLNVSKEYKNLFMKFIPYFESEIESIGDKTMEKEVDILKKLSSFEGN